MPGKFLWKIVVSKSINDEYAAMVVIAATEEEALSFLRKSSTQEFSSIEKIGASYTNESRILISAFLF